MECCLAFVEYCKAASKTAGDVIEGLVQKCVAAPKTKTKELATQICLMYCEAEAHEKVVEQLLAGFANLLFSLEFLLKNIVVRTKTIKEKKCQDRYISEPE